MVEISKTVVPIPLNGLPFSFLDNPFENYAKRTLCNRTFLTTERNVNANVAIVCILTIFLKRHVCIANALE